MVESSIVIREVMIMAVKSVPNIFKNTFFERFFVSNFGIVLRYWLFQGMLYMNFKELLFKLFFDMVLLIIFIFLGFNFFISFLIAHTLNMFLNGHYYVLLKNIGKLNNDPVLYIKHVEDFVSNLQGLKLVAGAASFGSLSRDMYTSGSDFDVRILPYDNFLSWLFCIFFSFKMRFFSFFKKFPIDIYVDDISSVIKRMRADEVPIVLYDPISLIASSYNNTISAYEFISNFKSKFV
jgi:hypothetical protein